MRWFPGVVAAAALVGVAFPGNAQAHPGHAHEVVSAQSGWHWLVQPEHAATLLFAAFLLVLSARLLHRYACVKRLKLAPTVIRRRDR